MSEPAPLGISFPNILFQVANFLLFLWILHRLLFKPLVAMLERRRQRIAESLDEADNLRKQVEADRAEFQAELAGARAQAQQIREEASRAAESLRARELEQARAEADRMRAEAAAEVDANRVRVAAELRTQTADLVLGATARVLNRSIDDPEHRRLVQEAIAEVAGEPR
jgi:F-type H+-transporting ATPase subunit b